MANTNKIYATYDFMTNQVKNIGNATDTQDAVAYGQILKRFTASIGDGSTTTFSITHGLSTLNVIIQIRMTSSPYTFITSGTTISLTDSNTASITFSSAPTSNQYTIIVIG